MYYWVANVPSRLFAYGIIENHGFFKIGAGEFYL
jgi:hypothetical protein